MFLPGTSIWRVVERVLAERVGHERGQARCNGGVARPRDAGGFVSLYLSMTGNNDILTLVKPLEPLIEPLVEHMMSRCLLL